jgi:hypothetical protein
MTHYRALTSKTGKTGVAIQNTTRGKECASCIGTRLGTNPMRTGQGKWYKGAKKPESRTQQILRSDSLRIQSRC